MQIAGSSSPTHARAHVCPLLRLIRSKYREKSRIISATTTTVLLSFLYVYQEKLVRATTDRTDDSCSSTPGVLSSLHSAFQQGFLSSTHSQDTPLLVLLPTKTTLRGWGPAWQRSAGGIPSTVVVDGPRDMRVEAPFMNDDVQLASLVEGGTRPEDTLLAQMPMA